MNPIPSILLTATLIGLASSPTAFAASMPDAESAPQDAKARYGQMPIAFEANQGQTDAQVRFLSRGPGYSLFLTPGEAVLSLRTPGGVDDAHGNLGSLQGTAAGEASRNAVVRLSFDGANPAPVLAGEQALASRSHYFLGSDAKAWQRDVANFSRVRYEDLYPGVDLVYYGSQKFELEYDLVVAPGSHLPRLDPESSTDVGTVLGNLVDNAVDASVSVGGTAVEVLLRLDAATVHLAVADTGPGVSPDRVGEIFRRGWSSKESTVGGRGVGLALVQVVCERRGGAVTVRAGDDGAGAVFEARLPGVARGVEVG